MAKLLLALTALGMAQENKPVNQSCPVNGAGVDAKYVVSVQGKTIAFCSRLCSNKFIAHMPVYLPAVPGFERKKPEDKKAVAGPCDLGKTVKGQACPGCRSDDVQGSLCGKCGSKPVPVDYCVKLTAPYVHAGEVFPRPDEDRARVVLACDACGVAGEVEIRHKPDCKPGVLKKLCAKSGTAPHHAATRGEEVAILPLPPRGDVRRARIETRHYRIYLEEYDPAEVADLAERAYAAWTDFFGRAPVPERGSDARLLLKGYATREAYVEGGREDKTPTPVGQPNMGYYWTGTRIAHFYAPDGEGAMRYMLLHEGTHQFHFQAMTGNAGAGPAWYAEGLGIWFGGSSWDAKAKTLKLGGGFKPGPLPAPARTLGSITSDPPAAVAFLVTRWPLQFRRLAAALDQHREERAAWREAFGFEEAPAEFAEDYAAWRAAAEERSFPGWGPLVGARAMPAAVRVAAWTLGPAAPASLVRLKEAVLKAEAQPKDVFEAGLGAVLKDLKSLPAPLASQAASAAATLAEARPAAKPPPKRAGLGLGAPPAQP